MSGWFLTAVGLLLLLEGGPLLLAPARWREVMRRVSALADGQLRFFGLMMVLAGAALVLVVNRGQG
jgi:uncharacterized protein YjeT (DUF2065 family)